MNLKQIALSVAMVAGCAVVTPLHAAAINAAATLDTTPNFNAGGGPGVLTDGVIGGNDWLNVPVFQYLGWQDAGYIPSDAGVDTAVSQPKLRFALGGMYQLDSVTINYMVDYPGGSLFANVRAPDEMTASFSVSGVNGPFGGNVVETGFNDGPESDARPGGGEARSLTVNLGGTVADAVSLDFLNNGEWTFLSEVSFQGTVVPEPGTCALLIVGALGLVLVRRRVSK